MDIEAAELGGTWRLYIAENSQCAGAEASSEKELAGYTCIPGSVPGNFELDMFKAGLIPDPFCATNAWDMRKYENRHLWYVRDFDAPDAPGEYYLLFEGVDTVAEVRLNGEPVLSCDNMFIPHRTGTLKLLPGRNTVMVHILPAVLEARKRPLPASSGALPYNYDSLYIRKAAHMYGWDIAPRLVSAGLWKTVRLMRRRPDSINDLFVYTDSADAGRARISAFFDLAVSSDDISPYSLKITGECGESRFEKETRLWHTNGRVSFGVPSPKLWFPKNMGEPNLYSVKAELYRGGELLDSFETRLGIRTVRLERTDTIGEDGGKFCFYVNGRRLFVMGTNWVQLDAYHSRDAERLPAALELLGESGCNFVRCWGGNVYEGEEFYSFCDSHGIMVWQDFAMGCGVYPQERKFADMLEKEAVSVIKRLRGHPSLAVWAGDNECDQAYESWGGTRRDPDENFLTRETLPRLLRAHDFTRPYIPSSPYLTSENFRTGRPSPEDHLWGPRDWFKGDYYKNAPAVFASETGYHGCPSAASLARFIPGDSLWPIFGSDGAPNPAWLCHASEMQPEGGAYSYRIALMASQIAALFDRKPENLGEFVRMSQISQAEAMKFFVERFRMGKWRRTGIIWWNLLDCWPQISDAVVDYYFDRKPAFYYIKRSQSPLCLMLGEPEKGEARLYAVNDTPRERAITYAVSAGGGTLCAGSAVIPPDSSAPIDRIPVREGEKKFIGIVWNDGEEHKNHFFAGLGKISFEDYEAAFAEFYGEPCKKG